MLILCCLLAGCDFAPKYAPPPTETPIVYKEAPHDAGTWQKAEPADAMPRGPWWSVFDDPTLDRLEQSVAGANQDIKAAVARFDEARAAASLAGTAALPTVTTTGSLSRDQISRTIANPRPANLYNDASLGATLSYELDLWGRVRNQIGSVRAQAQASEADLAFVDLSTHAELASDYFTLRGDDARQKILDEAVVAYGKAEALTKDRFTGGAAAEVDLDQAEAQFATAETEAADLRLQRAQLEHAIAILTGVPPSSFTLAPSPLDATPPSVTTGLPSTLLQRRPDVAQAERLVAAANAQIGVAEAAFFPVISLNAMLGLESGAPAKFFSLPSHFWSLGPSATLPIFDAGARSDISAEARANYDQTVANYRETVLGAYRDVEDNLAALNRLAEEAVTQDRAVDAAKRALTQAQFRYSGGIATYLEVVSAQNVALQSELSAADIKARRMTASVLLIRALGGGWDRATGLDVAGR